MFKEYKPDKEGIFLPPIEVKEHPDKGYICVAATDIDRGTLIERCPTIKLDKDMMKDLFTMVGSRTYLHDYVFCHSPKGYSYWAMGYGGIYSHSSNPNAAWRITYHPNGRDTIDIRAIRDIAKGEEIAYAYILKNSIDLLWFDPVE